MTNQNQLELGLAGANSETRPVSKGEPSVRANWWFSQMKQLAEHAVEWEPAPRFRLEPAGFGFLGSNRR